MNVQHATPPGAGPRASPLAAIIGGSRRRSRRGPPRRSVGRGRHDRTAPVCYSRGLLFAGLPSHGAGGPGKPPAAMAGWAGRRAAWSGGPRGGCSGMGDAVGDRCATFGVPAWGRELGDPGLNIRGIVTRPPAPSVQTGSCRDGAAAHGTEGLSLQPPAPMQGSTTGWLRAAGEVRNALVIWQRYSPTGQDSASQSPGRPGPGRRRSR